MRRPEERLRPEPLHTDIPAQREMIEIPGGRSPVDLEFPGDRLDRDGPWRVLPGEIKNPVARLSGRGLVVRQGRVGF